MKILILTSCFGMGHYCAAEAIKEELIAKGSEEYIEIVDIVKVLFPFTYKIIYKVFNNFICRFSFIYNWINRFATDHEEGGVKKRILKKIERLLKNQNPDLIIATWSAAARYVSDYKKQYEYKVPLYTYITDITVHEGWITEKSDMYFVGAESTKNVLLSAGIDESKIVIDGIPVRQAFKHEAKLGFNEGRNNLLEKKEILIMGGGLGLIPDLDNLLKKLSNISTIHITILTGKNKKLLKKLNKNYPEIEAVGYINRVNEYMERADLLITKPGGISTFEAIYSKVPLYVIKPFFSQELGNAEFIENMNIGKIVWNDEVDICKDIISIVNDTESIKNMKYNMGKLAMEVRESKLKSIYERDVKMNVGYNSIDSYYSIFNDIWNNHYISLQRAK